jgi:phosphatidylinositol glycan class N
MLHIQKMPKMYYAYVLFPVYFWNHILRNYRSLFEALRLSLASGFARFSVIIIASVLFLEALVRFSNIK